MTQLNSKGEIADFLDESQFIPGKSEYECVSYAASLIKFAGYPGKGPSGNVAESSNLAQYWYGRLEGGNAASNTNGMSLEALYTMLQGLGLPFTPCKGDLLTTIRAWLKLGYPVLLCGAETGMHDLDLGGSVPYAWAPSGNHAVVVSGVASDGNLLVHDTASIAPTGVRPDPRRYDAAKLEIVSATAITLPWLEARDANFDPTQIEETMKTIALTDPEVSRYFEIGATPNTWRCRTNGKILQDALLTFYQSYGNAGLCGLTFLGLPLSNEIYFLPGKRVSKQYFERGVVAYDPEKVLGNPPGSGEIYLLNIYEGPGQDPQIAALEQKITELQKTQSTALQSAIEKIKADVAALP